MCVLLKAIRPKCVATLQCCNFQSSMATTLISKVLAYQYNAQHLARIWLRSLCSQRWRETAEEMRERERINADMINDVRRAAEVHRQVWRPVLDIRALPEIETSLQTDKLSLLHLPTKSVSWESLVLCYKLSCLKTSVVEFIGAQWGIDISPPLYHSCIIVSSNFIFSMKLLP